MTQRTAHIPRDYNRIAVVDNARDLTECFMDGAVNCRLLPRALPAGADFAAAARDIADRRPYAHLDKKDLRALRPALPPASRAAADFILEDLERNPFSSLRVIRRDTHYRDGGDAIVERFHADRTQVPLSRLGRLCCCYNGAVTQGLRNDQAVRAETRPSVQRFTARLKQLEQMEVESDGFLPDLVTRDRLKAEDYDKPLYFPLRGAEIFSFKNGDLWYQSGESPGVTLPPFIHRAPPGPLPRRPEDPLKTVPRLLLVGI